MLFDERLTELRKGKGISQKECAAELGMTDASKYNKWENGKNCPDFETVVQLAKFFNVTTDYLLGASDCKQAENDNINKILGLSELSIIRIKQFNNMGLSDILSEMVFNINFTSAIHQIQTWLKLNLKSGFHAIVPKADFEALQDGGKGKALFVDDSYIKRMYAARAKDDMSKVIDEVLAGDD